MLKKKKKLLTILINLNLTSTSASWEMFVSTTEKKLLSDAFPVLDDNIDDGDAEKYIY